MLEGGLPALRRAESELGSRGFAQMPLEAIACNQCGAPLQVPDAAQFVNCNHCGASLAVRREESVTYTSIVAQLAEQTNGLAEQIAHLQYQNEAERIDRGWEAERQSMLIRHKNGTTSEPSSDLSAVGGVAMIIIGGLLFAAAIRTDVNDLGSAGLSVFGLGLVWLTLGRLCGKNFERAKAAYRRRRARLTVDQFRGVPDDEVTADEIPELK
jgi:hypothetical protein